ncbi:MAG: hypothetical protein BLM47_11465 [Candidatus Reconcilbacillus cellulovorans]|uniref:Uncharacterized protein n=1 Tax=Candidatus Reconcilbacillus cellulovorans TaxID=1906605 RepID=A0A2A6DXX7_9BACL|nr:MAG: hypothetical protein BLM47_11465 [Candidatus Reconcilbacillus cellulovorans]
MHVIQPVSKTQFRQWRGMPVCAVRRDGTGVYGILSRIADGKIILNEQAGEAPELLEAPRSRATRRNRGEPRRGRSQRAAPATAREDAGRIDPASSPSLFGPKTVLDRNEVAWIVILTD